jgi:hypothetical protein
MHNQPLTSNRINVTVGHQMFSIPNEHVNEILLLLNRLQSIQVMENPTPYLQYKGQSLINE